MKITLSLLFIAVMGCSFAQTDMFWNNYSNRNPAMSGFQYEQHASLTGVNRSVMSSLPNFNNAIANYNQRFFGKHGVGINYIGGFNLRTSHLLMLNYNYQFNLGNAGKLSAGVGIGGGTSKFRDKYTDLVDTMYISEPYNWFNLTIGAAYSWKNLTVGVATTDLTPPSASPLNPIDVPRIGINAFATYDFKLGENFAITPRANFYTNYGIYQLGTNVTTTFKKKYSLGVSYGLRGRYGVNVGWDFKEKLRVAYNYSRVYNREFGIFPNIFSHEFTLAYMIKRKPRVCGIMGNPK